MTRAAMEAEAFRCFREGMRLGPAHRYPEAEQQLRRALELLRQLDSGANPRLGACLNFLALSLSEQGKDVEAEPIARELLAVSRQLFPEKIAPRGHPAIVEALSALTRSLLAQNKLGEAEPLCREGLEMCRRLYPEKDNPRGNQTLVGSLSRMAGILIQQRKFVEAEPYSRQALAMSRAQVAERQAPDRLASLALSLGNSATLYYWTGNLPTAEGQIREALTILQSTYNQRDFPRGHRDVANAMRMLGAVLKDQGKTKEAQSYFRDALAMWRQLFPPANYPNGRPELIDGIRTLAGSLLDEGKLGEAEALFIESSNLSKKAYSPTEFPRGHPSIADGLTSLAGLRKAQQRLADAEQLDREALAIYRSVYPKNELPSGHPNLALGLTNLAAILWERHKVDEAESLFREALEMGRRLYPVEMYPLGHSQLARQLSYLSVILYAQGKLAEAETRCREALTMYRQLGEEFALARTEGEALNYLDLVPGTLGGYLSLTLRTATDAAAVYQAAWDHRSVARAFERRQIALRAATTTPKAKEHWQELSSLRARRAELLLAEHSRDPTKQRERDETLKRYAQRIDELNRGLRSLLPELARLQDSAQQSPSQLQRALPANTVLLHFVSYVRTEYDPRSPGEQSRKATDSYLVFIVTARAITRVELGSLRPIERNINLLREAIESAKAEPPADILAALREQLWGQIEKHLPAGTTHVCIIPEGPLAFLPWSALPGRQADSVLLDDYAIAIAPSGHFLLDKLTAAKSTVGPRGMLAIGGVRYSEPPSDPILAAITAKLNAQVSRGAPSRDGKATTWRDLPGTAKELERLGKLANTAGVPFTAITGAEPSATRLMGELPKYRFAHLATHGFFADPEFRARMKFDESLFAVSGGERVGAGALSPFVLSGVVCAGANRKETPGRGLLTAEALLNVDLSRMDLAVLSACDTGLGDVAGGEGVFGLQRAFHVAGCRNVIASLWKVEDEATAALMGLFYRNLWEKKLPPIEALRQAQLGLRNHPELIPGLGRGTKRAFEEVDLPVKPMAAGAAKTAPARQWAAFVLSGPGR